MFYILWWYEIEESDIIKKQVTIMSGNHFGK